MAQAEDTELRDLVIEALEKNGSLAKIRALLRANIFLAFEDECDSIKQNINLDNILKLPEGILALSIVHEFLEFCNLKNTLFVYMSESRQGRDYTYEGRKMLSERLNFINGNQDLKEPVLVTFVKNILRPYQRKYYEQGDGVRNKHDTPSVNNLKNDQNCTYIVHEDSSISTSQSISDNSSDEKNKLHLKLPLDNSDTDTSSDSVREKRSEYIPNQSVLAQVNSDVPLSLDQQPKPFISLQESNLPSQNSEIQNVNAAFHIHGLKTNILNSSDSTSYVDIKSHVPTNKSCAAAINKIGEKSESSHHNPAVISPGAHPQDAMPKVDSMSSSATLNSISSLSPKYETADSKIINPNSKTIDEPTKSDTEVTEYSLDFTSSLASKYKNNLDLHLHSPEQVQGSMEDKTPQNESARQNSQSSQSSVSISDVADLIEYSEKNLEFEHSTSKENLSLSGQSKTSKKSKNVSSDQNKQLSEDSGDFSESPVPSLSNLSLDVHSD